MADCCCRPVGYMYGAYVTPDGGHPRMSARVINCGSWECPYCRDRKAKEVMARALKGRIVEMAKRAGFREQYNFKFLTLTLPGKDFREKHTIEESLRMMSEVFHDLISELRTKRGAFDYLRVIEAQSDGYPHYHVLLVGEAIAPKQVLDDIERVWCREAGLGFVKINQVKAAGGDNGGIASAIKYCLKYLFKASPTFKRTRRYTSSRGGIEPPYASDRVWWRLTMRYTRKNGLTYPVLEAVVNNLLKADGVEWRVRYGDEYFDISVADREYIAGLEAIQDREASNG